ncbi:MAG: hypothetical protein EZS28_017945 [Streblomastix strix]|uniref:Uncharacterized protein n=1 Tax=Streblomastix strix TaxID=222440 RepID=A0A5J4VVP1_9EUKA|nr:MAG: hypothetical protein EZS28_017945 [Streblomastix strix]
MMNTLAYRARTQRYTISSQTKQLLMMNQQVRSATTNITVRNSRRAMIKLAQISAIPLWNIICSVSDAVGS